MTHETQTRKYDFAVRLEINAWFHVTNSEARQAINFLSRSGCEVTDYTVMEELEHMALDLYKLTGMDHVGGTVAGLPEGDHDFAGIAEVRSWYGALSSDVSQALFFLYNNEDQGKIHLSDPSYNGITGQLGDIRNKMYEKFGMEEIPFKITIDKPRKK